MQIFLPYADFVQTAKCLDDKRLGKQRIEAKQIIDLITGIANNRWKNHPVVKMWKNYINVLTKYYNDILFEYISRGHNNNMRYYNNFIGIDPPFLYNTKFHNSHKSKLLLKGEVDALVKSISDNIEGQQYHKWYMKYKLPKHKHNITYDMLDILYNINDDNEYINHYKQFNWNVPMNLDYVWF